MATATTRQVGGLVDDLRRIFGGRLKVVATYGWHKHGPTPSLALVDSISADDLSACAARINSWRRGGAATPLLLTPQEFTRSLDAFPIEYGEILSTHEIAYGTDPFDGLSISPEDQRRACEVQIKSHLFHLREDYLESGGRPKDVAALVRDSAHSFSAILRHLARLDGLPAISTGDVLSYARQVGLDPRTVSDVMASAEPDTMASVDPVRLFPAYLISLEQLAETVDRWRARS
jgi:hypothetical protein